MATVEAIAAETEYEIMEVTTMTARDLAVGLPGWDGHLFKKKGEGNVRCTFCDRGYFDWWLVRVQTGDSASCPDFLKRNAEYLDKENG